MDYEEGKEYLLQLSNLDIPNINPLIFNELYERYDLGSKDLTRILLSRGATLEDQVKAAFILMNEHPGSKAAKTLSRLIFNHIKPTL
jgi:hypothetical protein